MFPHKVTLFHYTEGSGYSRQLIENCFCYQDKKAHLNKSGMSTTDKLTVVVSTSNMLNINKGYDLIIKDDCSFDFDNSSEEMISKSLKELKSQFEAYTVLGVDDNLYGDLPNLVLHCE